MRDKCENTHCVLLLFHELFLCLCVHWIFHHCNKLVNEDGSGSSECSIKCKQYRQHIHCIVTHTQRTIYRQFFGDIKKKEKHFTYSHLHHPATSKCFAFCLVCCSWRQKIQLEHFRYFSRHRNNHKIHTLRLFGTEDNNKNQQQLMLFDLSDAKSFF